MAKLWSEVRQAFQAKHQDRIRNSQHGKKKRSGQQFRSHLLTKGEELGMEIFNCVGGAELLSRHWEKGHVWKGMVIEGCFAFCDALDWDSIIALRGNFVTLDIFVPALFNTISSRPHTSLIQYAMFCFSHDTSIDKCYHGQPHDCFKMSPCSSAKGSELQTDHCSQFIHRLCTPLNFYFGITVVLRWRSVARRRRDKNCHVGWTIGLLDCLFDLSR